MKSFYIIAVLLTAIVITPFQLSYAGYDDFTLNVPNAQGGYTAIVIKKSGNGYVGPQGEYYQQFPTVAQLQTMYGLGSPAPAPIIAPVAPVAYVEPPVQRVITYQVVNQAPYEEGEEDDYNYQPSFRPPNVAEIETPPEEENDWKFFAFKKKKKSQQSSTSKQSSTTPATQPPSAPPAKQPKDNSKSNQDHKNHGNQQP